MSLKMNKIIGLLLSSAICTTVNAYSPYHPLKRTEIILEKASTTSPLLQIKSIRADVANQLLKVESGEASLLSGILENQKASLKLLGIMIQENSKPILICAACGTVVYLADLSFNDGKLTGTVVDYVTTAKDNIKYYGGKVTGAISSQVATVHNGLLSLLSGKYSTPTVSAETVRIAREVTANTAPNDESSTQVEQTPVTETVDTETPSSDGEVLNPQHPSIIIVTDQAPVILQLPSSDLFADLAIDETSRRPYHAQVHGPRPKPAAKPKIEQVIQQAQKPQEQIIEPQPTPKEEQQVQEVPEVQTEPEQEEVTSQTVSASEPEPVQEQAQEQEIENQVQSTPDDSSTQPETRTKSRRTKKH